MPKKERLTDQAYHGILQLVEEGHFRDDRGISFNRLSDRLKMSRMPVSIAVDRLERDGVLESSPRLGTRVQRMDAETIWGLIRWRIALECEIAREASLQISRADGERLIEAGLRTDEDLERIAPGVQELKTLVNSGRGNSPEAAELMHSISARRLGLRYDNEFHLLLAELSGVKKLRTELARFMDVFPVKVAVCEAVEATVAYTVPNEYPPMHEDLARAVIDGDPDQASTLMRRHIENSVFIFGFQQWYRRYRR